MFQTDRFKSIRMARPKAYDRKKVVDDATQLFWQKGYHGTSLSELVSVTGLNKHSMYKEFGSKAELFNECLENYGLKVTLELSKILTKKPLGLGNIRAFFENRIEYICSDEFKGCLVVKSTVEKELLEVSAVELLKVHSKLFEDALGDCLRAAIEAEELPATADPELLTQYLVRFIAGMLVMGEPKNGEAEARKLVDMVLAGLKT